MVFQNFNKKELFLPIMDWPIYLFHFQAYAVIYCKADCGIMVTASHNPKEDNGYKVYGSNGSQVSDI